MTQNTPGPWVTDIPNDTLVARMEDGVYHYYIADAAAPMVRRSHEECAANARLIAAAPDLLAALKDMAAGWRYIREHHGDLYGVGWDRCEDAARAAIAKAEGIKK